jgi:hypothetical protein
VAIYGNSFYCWTVYFLADLVNRCAVVVAVDPAVGLQLPFEAAWANPAAARLVLQRWRRRIGRIRNVDVRSRPFYLFLTP